MSDALRRLHEAWLGMAQPIEGLVFSATVLADKGVGRPDEAPAQLQKRFLALCPPSAIVDGQDARPRVADLSAFLEELLELTPDLFDSADDLPPALSLDVPEADQLLRPTLALKKQHDVHVPEGTDATDAAKAGAAYEMLVWDLGDHAGAGLDLDAPEAVTGHWRYPPTAKLDRLLRHVRVPIGLLTNREEIRLIYAPHGESTGHLTFRLKDMADVGGRPILDAFVSLLSAHRFFGGLEDATPLALLVESRKRQANVTNELASQVFDALQVLLAGLQAAAERDPDHYGQVFGDALEREDEHVYRGLLTVMLRLVFLLFAEDRSLLPVERPLYAEHLSILALFERLQEDAGAHPDSMAQRFGAWGQLLVLFRAIFTGADHDELHMPPRRGDLFDPHRYPFLEGVTAGASPLNAPELQAEVAVPTIDDGTVYAILERLVVFEGHRLSYKALDVEQIGSVYEALMGYHVERMEAPAVRMKSGLWLTVDQVLAIKPAQRAKWLKTEVGLSTAEGKKLADRFVEITKSDLDAAAKSAAYQDALAEHSAAGRKRDKSAVLARVGQLVLQPGAERRRTSSHYTPRSLSEPIVRRTLEPLLACMGDAPPSDRLLELKVCDPAMGSGAFLVEACRFLADHLVAAWTREGKLEEVAKSAPGEDPVLHARRLVAQRCLYGVDKNEAAVELAKLSLWLVTLAKDLPFTFLDHALRHGDSLVGLSFDQIRSFHWKPGKQLELAERVLKEALDEAIAIRQQILALAGDGSPEAQRLKETLVRDADDASGRARLIGDVVVGAFFAEQKDKAREKERARRVGIVQRWLDGDAEAGEELRGLQAEIRERLPVFHWMLEFPEVFYAERPDPLEEGRVNNAAFMDAFLGNPPFLGGAQLSEAMGSARYQEWLKSVFDGAFGHADIVAYFLRLAGALIGAHGTMGFITTNSISEGASRVTGLQWMLTQGDMLLYCAVPSSAWPGSAAVHVAQVHLARGRPRARVQPTLNDVRVIAINSRLQPTSERSDPLPLRSNEATGFHGTKIDGDGFLLSPAERERYVSSDASCATVILPYVNGATVNSPPSPDHERYVINFGSRSLEDAANWPDLLDLVRTRVKPVRDRAKDHGPGKHGKKYWWQHVLRRDPLYQAIAPLTRCIVIAITTKHSVFSFQPTNRLFSHALTVFALDRWTHFASLQSRPHEAWAWLLSSSLGEGLRYSVSDCFDTFPFPEPDPRATVPSLEDIGQRLYERRSAYMLESQQGLTQTYNRLKDPTCHAEPILELRRLHEEMDRAVLDAYGWTDIEVPPYCPRTPAETQALEAFQDEVIDRLFVLNAERAKEEAGMGALTKTKRKKAPTVLGPADAKGTPSSRDSQADIDFDQ